MATYDPNNPYAMVTQSQPSYSVPPQTNSSGGTGTPKQYSGRNIDVGIPYSEGYRSGGGSYSSGGTKTVAVLDHDKQQSYLKEVPINSLAEGQTSITIGTPKQDASVVKKNEAMSQKQQIMGIQVDHLSPKVSIETISEKLASGEAKTVSQAKALALAEQQGGYDFSVQPKTLDERVGGEASRVGSSYDIVGVLTEKSFIGSDRQVAVRDDIKKQSYLATVPYGSSATPWTPITDKRELSNVRKNVIKESFDHDSKIEKRITDTGDVQYRQGYRIYNTSDYGSFKDSSKSDVSTVSRKSIFPTQSFKPYVESLVDINKIQTDKKDILNKLIGDKGTDISTKSSTIAGKNRILNLTSDDVGFKVDDLGFKITSKEKSSLPQTEIRTILDPYTQQSYQAEVPINFDKIPDYERDWSKGSVPATSEEIKLAKQTFDSYMQSLKGRGEQVPELSGMGHVYKYPVGDGTYNIMYIPKEMEDYWSAERAYYDDKARQSYAYRFQATNLAGVIPWLEENVQTPIISGIRSLQESKPYSETLAEERNILAKAYADAQIGRIYQLKTNPDAFYFTEGVKIGVTSGAILSMPFLGGMGATASKAVTSVASRFGASSQTLLLPVLRTGFWAGATGVMGTFTAESAMRAMEGDRTAIIPTIIGGVGTAGSASKLIMSGFQLSGAMGSRLFESVNKIEYGKSNIKANMATKLEEFSRIPYKIKQKAFPDKTEVVTTMADKRLTEIYNIKNKNVIKHDEYGSDFVGTKRQFIKDEYGNVRGIQIERIDVLPSGEKQILKTTEYFSGTKSGNVMQEPYDLLSLRNVKYVYGDKKGYISLEHGTPRNVILNALATNKDLNFKDAILYESKTGITSVGGKQLTPFESLQLPKTQVKFSDYMSGKFGSGWGVKTRPNIQTAVAESTQKSDFSSLFKPDYLKNVKGDVGARQLILTKYVEPATSNKKIGYTFDNKHTFSQKQIDMINADKRLDKYLAEFSKSSPEDTAIEYISSTYGKHFGVKPSSVKQFSSTPINSNTKLNIEQQILEQPSFKYTSVPSEFVPPKVITTPVKLYPVDTYSVGAGMTNIPYVINGDTQIVKPKIEISSYSTEKLIPSYAIDTGISMSQTEQKVPTMILSGDKDVSTNVKPRRALTFDYDMESELKPSYKTSLAIEGLTDLQSKPAEKIVFKSDNRLVQRPTSITTPIPIEVFDLKYDYKTTNIPKEDTIVIPILEYKYFNTNKILSRNKPKYIQTPITIVPKNSDSRSDDKKSSRRSKPGMLTSSGKTPRIGAYPDLWSASVSQARYGRATAPAFSSKELESFRGRFYSKVPTLELIKGGR